MATQNTMDFKEFWDLMYEITHYKIPAYQAIADESEKNQLTEGQKLHRTFSSDIPSDNLGPNGEYRTTPITDTDEFLLVQTFKQASFTLKRSDFTQATLPVVKKYAQKTMNSLFTQIDADVLGAAYNGAGSVVDASALGGTSGQSIPLTSANVQLVTAAAEQQLRLQNVIYNPAATFSGDFKLDKVKMMPVAVVSAQFYTQLVIYLGSKTTALGDDVSRNGFVGKYLGFSLFVSNGLPWTSQIQIPTNPTNGDTITLLYNVNVVSGGTPTSQALTFTFVNSIGTTAGNVLIAGSAAATATNLASILNAPFTTTANGVGFVPQNVGLGNSTTGSITTMQQRALANVAATQVTINTGTANPTTGTAVNLQVNGMGNVPASATFTSGNNSIPTIYQTQHNLFGVGNGMISVVIQRRPEFRQQQSLPVAIGSAGYSGRIATDYITWVPYGYKVFNDQTPQIVDVQINTSTYSAMPVAINF